MDISQMAVAIAMGATLAALLSFFLTLLRNSRSAAKGDIIVIIKKGWHTIEILNPTSDEIETRLGELRDFKNNHPNSTDEAK